MQYLNNHQATGLLKLVPPFWGKPRIAALLLGYLREVQALEDAIWSFISGIDVETCERFALEGLAKIVGEKSRPESTETLRTLVRGRIAVNRSDTTPASIDSVVGVLASGSVLVLDHGPREVRVLQLTAPGPDDPDAAARLLDAACGGGTKGCWLTNAGAGGCARPEYGATAPNHSRRRGLVPRSNYHG